MQTNKSIDNNSAQAHHSAVSAAPERMPTVGWRQINDFSCNLPRINFAPSESLALRGTYVRQEKLVLRTDAEMLLAERNVLTEELASSLERLLSVLPQAELSGWPNIVEACRAAILKTRPSEKIEQLASSPVSAPRKPASASP